ncbi:MAG: polyprenyl synthetase family protein, partial [Halioglobus sp.]|nr:polyprenyl synthetase family protein [Halioglobus sp.]
LAGDGLQALAFQLLAEAPGLDDAQKIAMVAELARAAGGGGMVGGQYVDIQATDSDLAHGALQAMHAMKTGALIRAAVVLGGIAANGSRAQLQALDGYGRDIGLAFQVKDDILDVTGDTATLGKTGGKDGEANKPTYVKLLGLDGARKEAGELLQSAIDNLQAFGDSAEDLRRLARYIVARDH